MSYQKDSQTVIYRRKMNPVVKKNFAVFPVLDWIATLTAQKIKPEGGEVATRKPEVIEVAPAPVSKELKNAGPISSERSMRQTP
jgi:hypothetical protein